MPPTLRTIAAAALALLLAACAGFGLREPVVVSVVGLQPMPGEGMEGRFLMKLRVQNPNEHPIDYDGVFVELDVRGSRLATGVSDARGSVPRFGEAIVAVPVSIPVSALLRQALGLAAGDRSRIDYRLRGRLAGPASFGGTSFTARGELTLPSGVAGTEPAPRLE